MTFVDCLSNACVASSLHLATHFITFIGVVVRWSTATQSTCAGNGVSVASVTREMESGSWTTLTSLKRLRRCSMVVIERACAIKIPGPLREYISKASSTLSILGPAKSCIAQQNCEQGNTTLSREERTSIFKILYQQGSLVCFFRVHVTQAVIKRMHNAKTALQSNCQTVLL